MRMAIDTTIILLRRCQIQELSLATVSFHCNNCQVSQVLKDDYFTR